jgi:gustatory receptor
MLVTALRFNNIDELTQQWYLTLTAIACMSKVLNYWVKYDRVIELYEYIENIETKPASQLDEVDQKCLIRIVKLDRYIQYYFCATIIATLAICVAPAFSEVYRLPIFSWFYGVPYGEKEVVSYYILFAYQVFGIAMQALCNVALDSSVCYMMLIAERQFCDLGRKLKAISVDANEGKVMKTFVEYVSYYEKITL